MHLFYKREQTLKNCIIKEKLIYLGVTSSREDEIPRLSGALFLLMGTTHPGTLGLLITTTGVLLPKADVLRRTEGTRALLGSNNQLDRVKVHSIQLL